MLPTLRRVDACHLHRQRCCTFHGRCTRPSATVPSPLPLSESGTCYHRRSRHCHHCRLWSVHWRRNCFADRTPTHTSGNSSIDTSLIRDIYCGPEVLFETCVAMKFVDDDATFLCITVYIWARTSTICVLSSASFTVSMVSSLITLVSVDAVDEGSVSVRFSQFSTTVVGLLVSARLSALSASADLSAEFCCSCHAGITGVVVGNAGNCFLNRQSETTKKFEPGNYQHHCRELFLDKTVKTTKIYVVIPSIIKQNSKNLSNRNTHMQVTLGWHCPTNK